MLSDNFINNIESESDLIKLDILGSTTLDMFTKLAEEHKLITNIHEIIKNKLLLKNLIMRLYN